MNWSTALALLALLGLSLLIPLSSANGMEAVAEIQQDGWNTIGGHFILGDVVECTGTSSVGDNLTYSWDVDNRTDTDINGNYTDDADATGENLTWVYSYADNRTVTLTITSGNRTINATVWVNMSVNRAPTIFIGSFTSLVGETFDLMDEIEVYDPEGRPLLLEIDLDEDSKTDIVWTSQDGGNTDHVFTDAGTFRIKGRLSDGNNTIFGSGNVTVIDAGTVKGVSKRYSNDDHVLPGAYFAYKVSLDKGDRIDLNYRVVKGKGNPKLLVMDASAYFFYKNYHQRNNITLIPELSNPNGTLAEIISWEADVDDTYYFVIDNGYQSGGGQETVSYLVIIDIDRKRETPGFEAVPFVISMLGAALLVASRKR